MNFPAKGYKELKEDRPEIPADTCPLIDNTLKHVTGIEVNLEPGDIMIYRGNMVEHCREPLESDDAVQCFLHYNDSNKKEAALNAADTRQHLGLPGWFRGK